MTAAKEAAAKPAPVRTSAAGLAARFGGGGEKCTKCGKTVYVAERAIAQNIIHKKFLVYRNVPSIADILGPSDVGKSI